jgi:hypothetical protein
MPGREIRIDADTLRDAADVAAGTYTLRGQGGAGDAIAHPPAVSLARVLELAAVAPDALSFVSVRRADGTLIVLGAGDLARPAPFPEGPPLVWLDADSVRFLRPVRDDADVNAADNIATAGEDLIVRVQQGPLLRVALRIAPAAPRAGERARLEARVAGAQPGAAVTVRWRFGDGTEATGSAVSHRWRKPGVYAVVASASGDGDSSGASEPLVVRVGAARERPGRTGGGAGDRERSPTTGPSEPPEQPPAPAAAGSPPASTPAPAAAPESAADARQSTSPTSPRDASARERPRKRRLRARHHAVPTGAAPVRGVLVSATIPSEAAAAPAPASPVAARAGALPDDPDGAIPAVGVAAACSLLALGAWRERRPRRP